MILQLDESEIWDLVDRALHAHLGCSAGGRTYVVPISYARDGKRLLGLTTTGRKVEMMRENPEVCVQVEEVKSLTDWKSVVLWGRYEELSGAERTQATGLLIDRYGPGFAEGGDDARRGRSVTPPRLDGQAQPLVVYAIHVTEFSGRAEARREN